MKLDKKSIFYFGIIILASLISFFLILHFSKTPEISRMPEIKVPLPAKPSQEEIIKKQLEELEKLRGEATTLTEKEIKTQLKELEKLKGKQKPLSSEELQKQLDELETLR